MKNSFLITNPALNEQIPHLQFDPCTRAQQDARKTGESKLVTSQDIHIAAAHAAQAGITLRRLGTAAAEELAGQLGILISKIEGLTESRSGA